MAAARSPSSYLAATVELLGPVDAMCRLGLARVDGEGVFVDPVLLGLSDVADKFTLHNIARLLLVTDPPLWLSVAVTPTGVAREYIPQPDLAALRWLGPALDEVLSAAHADVAATHPDPFRKAIGDTAELFVLAALERAGAKPVHVAKISDRYGYDIEARKPKLRRIEVKAAGPASRGSFHLSRNEFDKSRRYGSEWRLLQVVFRTSALFAKTIDCSHVEGMFVLDGNALDRIVPADSTHFKWTESAAITCPDDQWRPARLSPDPTFTAPGLHHR
ncbi:MULTISPECIES: DUF3883 domain-containing protein [unclassified Saccharothrix]|uniref:DUF3883 domain-containing protein n=1 Tax=unclassified Saccharothrix TaxID=2593673 RepID=UPI00307E673C